MKWEPGDEIERTRFFRRVVYGPDLDSCHLWVGALVALVILAALVVLVTLIALVALFTGLVLALGLLTPVLAVDNGLNTLAGWIGSSRRAPSRAMSTSN